MGADGGLFCLVLFIFLPWRFQIPNLSDFAPTGTSSLRPKAISTARAVAASKLGTASSCNEETSSRATGESGLEETTKSPSAPNQDAREFCRRHHHHHHHHHHHNHVWPKYVYIIYNIHNIIYNIITMYVCIIVLHI